MRYLKDRVSPTWVDADLNGLIDFAKTLAPVLLELITAIHILTTDPTTFMVPAKFFKQLVDTKWFDYPMIRAMFLICQYCADHNLETEKTGRGMVTPNVVNKAKLVTVGRTSKEELKNLEADLARIHEKYWIELKQLFLVMKPALTKHLGFCLNKVGRNLLKQGGEEFKNGSNTKLVQIED